MGNDFRYLLGDRWYANTTQDFLNSDEQSLDLRTTIGLGGGRYLLRSTSQYLAVGAGLAWTREDYTDPEIETKNSTEAYLGTEFMTEKLKIADLVTRLNYYPSLTIDDRYRINYTFDLDFNLPGRLVHQGEPVRELRQPAAGRPVEERLGLVECLRLQVLRTSVGGMTSLTRQPVRSPEVLRPRLPALPCR